MLHKFSIIIGDIICWCFTVLVPFIYLFILTFLETCCRGKTVWKTEFLQTVTNEERLM